MKLVLDGKVIWENPKILGHFGVKLRKQVYEYRLAEEVGRRIQAYIKKNRLKRYRWRGSVATEYMPQRMQGTIWISSNKKALNEVEKVASHLHKKWCGYGVLIGLYRGTKKIHTAFRATK